MKNYLIVTSSYWGFTLTDGALRMLVLLHFFKLGFSPFTLAFLFLLYEAAGIFANLFGGWLATYFGITKMLFAGIAVQIIGLIALSLLNNSWSMEFSILWVFLSQGISGIAKDFTKTASKSAIKVTTNESQHHLYKLVAWFTGSKNSMKGIGFFLGGLLLETFGFKHGLWLMAFCLFLILIISIYFLPKNLGKSMPSKSIKELFSKSKNINILSLARIFLFGARDIWFVVGLPVFLYSNKWEFWQVGSFLAIWTIVYGGMQSMAPKISGTSHDGKSRELLSAKFFIIFLTLIPIIILIYNFASKPKDIELVIIIILGLSVFSIPFAINSSLHSYLVLAYSKNKIAEDVGFYYAANASGRLLGTLLSGILYQFGGINFCLIGCSVFLIICSLLTFSLSK